MYQLLPFNPQKVDKSEKNNGEVDKLITGDQNESPVNISTYLPEKVEQSSEIFQSFRCLQKKIANILSHYSQDDFECKLGQLKFINEAWCKGDEIGLLTFPDLSETSNDVAPAVAETGTDVEIEFEAAEAEVVLLKLKLKPKLQLKF